MDKNQEIIIKKIQKLYRLAESAGSESEAENAMQRAREMLSKYNLTLQDVESFREEECGESVFTIKKAYQPSYSKFLARAMETLFSCDVVSLYTHDNGNPRVRLLFIGVGPDAVLACQTYDFLYTHAKRKAREYKYTPAQTNEYLYWFAVSIDNRADEIIRRLRESLPHETALVPVKNAAVDAYMSRHHPDLVSGRPATRSRFTEYGAQGVRDGEAVNLDRQVDAQNLTALAV